MKKISVLSVLIFVLMACACISCATLASNLLLSTGIISKASALSTPQQNFYAISVCSATSAADLEEAKLELQAQGGAGYVFCQNEQYFLLASLYNNRPDAELVKSNLQSQNVECEIVELSVAGEKISGNFAEQEKEVLLDCLKSTTSTYKFLYDVAISLDTSVFSLTKAKLECNNIYSSAVAKKTNFESFFSDKNLTTLSEKLLNNTKVLEKLTKEEYETSSQNFSSLIKLTYFRLLFG